MRKIIMIALIALTLTIAASGEEYWNLRTTAHGLAARFSDDFGMAAGMGVRFLFGPRDGDYDFGFELEKWFRSYETFDREIDSLIIIGPQDSGGIDVNSAYVDNDQSSLGFSMIFRYKFWEIGSGMIYAGTGGGFSFIQHKIEDARQSTETGFWEVFKISDYLETKFQGMALVGFERSLNYNFDFYLEGKFTYVSNAFIDKGNDQNGNPIRNDIWDDPYFVSGNLGLRYSF